MNDKTAARRDFESQLGSSDVLASAMEKVQNSYENKAKEELYKAEKDKKGDSDE